jgi:hypothetical protein
MSITPGVTYLPAPSITVAPSGARSLPTPDDLAVAEQHRTTIDPPAFAVEDGDVGQQRRRAGISVIGRRVRIVAIALALAWPFGGGLAGGAFGFAAIGGASCQRHRDCQHRNCADQAHLPVSCAQRISLH